VAIMYTWKPIEEIRHRMDPAHWDPAHDAPMQEMQRAGWEIKTIGDVLKENRVISSDCVRASRGEAIGEQFAPEYYTVGGILSTGYDTTQLMHCSDNAYERLKRSQVRHKDIVVARSGKGSVGKVCVVHEPGKRACVGDLFILRVVGANPYWVAAFLKSRYGQAQMERVEHGVSRMTHLRTADVRGLLLPLVPPSIQSHVEERYKQMSKFHDAAMEAKVAGNEAEYKERLTYAEQLLAELVEYVENTIRLGPQSVGSAEDA